MTSSERRDRRYQRRRKARLNKLEQSQKSFEEIFSLESLWDSAKKCCLGSGWKTSVINFKTYMLREVSTIFAALHEERRKFGGFASFQTVEHGKRREINALTIQDRTAQKCICTNFLVSLLSRSFVYDNGACLPGKGQLFQVKRLRKHLSDHYRKHGLEGGIYQYDFKGYFASISHKKIKERLREKILDDKVYRLMCDFIDDFQYLKISNKDESSAKGIGLGSEVSQVIGLEFASPIDHYVKDHCGVHGYGRYNDDGYIISHDLRELQYIQKEIFAIAEELGIALNPRKNKITPFRSHSFTFLKLRFRMTETGRIITKISRKNITHQRKKLKKMRQKVIDGTMTYQQVSEAYQAWRAYARSFKCFDTVRRMDALFLELFKYDAFISERPFKCSYKAVGSPYAWLYQGLPK